jgi:hypothetical protein
MPLLLFQTFTSAGRKANMQRFGMFRADATADLAVIDSAASATIGFTGTQDGSNTTFTVSAAPSKVFRNGLLQKATVDYSIVSNTIVWVIPPAADDIILGFTE